MLAKVLQCIRRGEGEERSWFSPICDVCEPISYAPELFPIRHSVRDAFFSWLGLGLGFDPKQLRYLEENVRNAFSLVIHTQNHLSNFLRDGC